MRPRLTVTRHLKLYVPRQCIHAYWKLGWTIQWRIQAQFLSGDIAKADRILPATIVWADKDMVELSIWLETRTYVRYRC